jgi:hypothetical protein
LLRQVSGSLTPRALRAAACQLETLMMTNAPECPRLWISFFGASTLQALLWQRANTRIGRSPQH